MKKLTMILVLMVAMGLVFSGAVSAGKKTTDGKSEQTMMQKIDINTADADTLQQLKGIGPKLADKIIAYRNTHKRFKSVDELMMVSGIGEKMFKSIQPQVMVK